MKDKGTGQGQDGTRELQWAYRESGGRWTWKLFEGGSESWLLLRGGLDMTLMKMERALRTGYRMDFSLLTGIWQLTSTKGPLTGSVTVKGNGRWVVVA